MTKLNLSALDALREKETARLNNPDITRLLICGGTGCHATGSIAVKKALNHEIADKGLEDSVKVVETGCNGFCALGPLMVIQPGGIFYTKLKADDIPELVESHVVNGEVVERLLYKDPATKKRVARLNDISFFAHQSPRALRNKGLIDPEKISEYIARDGYKGVAKALIDMTPEEIIRR